MSVRVTEDVLRRMCAEPEPSTEGTWFLVNLKDLLAAGHTHIEFHFADDSTSPNDAALHTVDEEYR